MSVQPKKPVNQNRLVLPFSALKFICLSTTVNSGFACSSAASAYLSHRLAGSCLEALSEPHHRASFPHTQP